MYPVRIIPTAAFLLLAAIALLLPSAPAPAADEPDYSGDLPRLAPLEPAKALESFKLAKGFRIDLVAAEPLVTDPIAMAFDEDGRLFVIEMRDYSEHPNDNLGQVRLLEDTDGDGIMDRSTIFAEKLSWPTAIICSQGGVFVGAAPHILYLKDTNGDGKADVNKIVYTGLGRSNVQGLVNTFLYGLDHRIHVAASSAGGTLTRPDDPNFKPIPLRGRDFAFDPITFEAEAITGGAQHGATFDDYGRRFVCSNSDHIQMVMIEDRYTVNAAPGLAAPPTRMSIAADGPQAEVFRISPVEPWRVLRTKLRVSGAVPGIVEGGGRAAGYFTSATGLTIYRGDAMPDQRGNAFVADVGSNIIHRKKLTPRGIGFIATRIDEKAEFVASTDTWFRPVQMANGPDGCLWVADMYREVIEHPASLPPVIKKHLDLNSGRDRGRIYRIAPEGFKPRAMPKLGKATTAELVAQLEHDNAWHRETASRLLHERKDREAVRLMEIVLVEAKSPLGRLHALYAIHGHDDLTAAHFFDFLKDPSPEVREHAVRLAEGLLPTGGGLSKSILELVSDASPRVRFQVAQSIGYATARTNTEVAAQLLSSGSLDIYSRWAAMTITGGTLVPAIESALRDPSIFIGSLIEALRDNEIVPTLKVLESAEVTSVSTAQSIATRINRQGGDPAALMRLHAPRLLRPLEAEWDRFELHFKPPVRPDRGPAIWILSSAPLYRSGPLLATLFDPMEPPALQHAAIEALAIYGDKSVADILIKGLKTANPTVKGKMIDELLARDTRVKTLLGAMEKDPLLTALLTPQHKATLLALPDAASRQLAQKLVNPPAERQPIVTRYANDLQKVTGFGPRGKTLFATHCSACHKLENVGHELGPNLAVFAQKGTDAILINLLDPNREVNPQYLNYVIELKDGEIVSGIITSESASSVTIASGKGVDRTVARSEITTLRATLKSIMPEGLEEALDAQAVADVIAYLMSLKDAK